MPIFVQNSANNIIKMKKNLVLIFILINSTAFCQSYSSHFSKQDYDSSKNFVGPNLAALKYIGQEFYLPKSRWSTTVQFVKDFNKSAYEKDNVYKCDRFWNPLKTEIEDRYYDVLTLEKSYNSEDIFLKLVNKSNNDTVYYRYKAIDASDFPFIVSGFYIKQKQKLIGQKFVFDNYITERLNISISTDNFKLGQIMTVSDLIIDTVHGRLNVILENDLKNNVPYAYDLIFSGKIFGRVYSKEEAEDYKKDFGNYYFDLVLKHELKIGMNSRMAKLIEGFPNKINRTETQNTIYEQWVYDEKYLYFENGKLTTIQD